MTWNVGDKVLINSPIEMAHLHNRVFTIVSVNRKDSLHYPIAIDVKGNIIPIALNECERPKALTLNPKVVIALRYFPSRFYCCVC